METTSIVGLITLALGVCAAIVGIALVAREQPIAWIGIIIGVVMLRVSYRLLQSAPRETR